MGLLAEIVGQARVEVRSAGQSSEGLDWGTLVDEILWPLISAGLPDEASAAADDWASAVIAGQTAADAGRAGTDASRAGTDAGRAGTDAGRAGAAARPPRAGSADGVRSTPRG